MSEQAAPMAPWQRGVPLDVLRQAAALFREHDEGLVLGAFTGYKENAVAAAMARGQLRARMLGGEPRALLVAEEVKTRRAINGFDDNWIGRPEVGDLYLRRMAVWPERPEELFTLVARTLARVEDHAASSGGIWAEVWQEHPVERAIVEWMGLTWVGTKIMASSELRGIWTNRPEACRQVPDVDRVGLSRLARLEEGGDPLVPDGLALDRALGAIDRMPEAADHYSSYNKRHSWAALSLRGYGRPGEPSDPAFIIKPEEMSRKWREENPETLAWEPEDSPLRERFPQFDPLIDLVPGEKERVRVMLLRPGGGELTRHSDITDPDAGTGDGRLMRVHIPLQTNPGVRFRSWGLMGEADEAHMAVGEVWYLDTRKPHTARNDGEEDRWHLVMDVAAGPELRAWAAQGKTTHERTEVQPWSR